MRNIGRCAESDQNGSQKHNSKRITQRDKEIQAYYRGGGEGYTTIRTRTEHTSKLAVCVAEIENERRRVHSSKNLISCHKVALYSIMEEIELFPINCINNKQFTERYISVYVLFNSSQRQPEDFGRNCNKYKTNTDTWERFAMI